MVTIDEDILLQQFAALKAKQKEVARAAAAEPKESEEDRRKRARAEALQKLRQAQAVKGSPLDPPGSAATPQPLASAATATPSSAPRKEAAGVPASRASGGQNKAKARAAAALQGAGSSSDDDEFELAQPAGVTKPAPAVTPAPLKGKRAPPPASQRKQGSTVSAAAADTPERGSGAVSTGLKMAGSIEEPCTGAADVADARGSTKAKSKVSAAKLKAQDASVPKKASKPAKSKPDKSEAKAPQAHAKPGSKRPLLAVDGGNAKRHASEERAPKHAAARDEPGPDSDHDAGDKAMMTYDDI